MRRVARRDDGLNDQEATIRLDGATAATQDGETLVLVPVVDDVRQQVGVAPTGNAVKEIARLDRDPLFDATRPKQGGSVAHDMRPVEQNTSWRSVVGQDRGQHVARRATYVH